MALRPSAHEVTCLVSSRGAVVVVARIGRLDTRVALQRQRTDYVRERFVGQPGRTVIVGLASLHL